MTLGFFSLFVISIVPRDLLEKSFWSVVDGLVLLQTKLRRRDPPWSFYFRFQSFQIWSNYSARVVVACLPRVSDECSRTKWKSREKRPRKSLAVQRRGWKVGIGISANGRFHFLFKIEREETSFFLRDDSILSTPRSNLNLKSQRSFVVSLPTK